MEKPNLDKMWETFIRIGEMPFIDLTQVIRMIRNQIHPMLSRLVEDGTVNWYSFLIHSRGSGVPTTEDDNILYFHIRVSARNQTKPSFPDYCVLTRRINREWVNSISGIDTSLLKNEEIEEAWRIIGEQSEWLLRMLNIYKENTEIPLNQVRQFYHFFANMAQIRIM